MKFYVLISLFAFNAAAPRQKEIPIIVNEATFDANSAVGMSPFFNLRRPDNKPKPPNVPNLPTSPDELIHLLLDFVNDVIANGYPRFGIPPLEPLYLDNFEFSLPAELMNIDLKLKGVHATGFGKFVLYKSDLDMNELCLDIDVGFPVLDIAADEYDMIGDLFTVIPLYGKGKAHFYVEGFRLQAKLFLEQSDNGMSVLVNRVENAAYSIPHLKSNLTGAIGGGDIDAIVNVMIEEVIMSYVNRFHGAIAVATSTISTIHGNTLLNQLDSWRYIASLLPTPR